MTPEERTAKLGAVFEYTDTDEHVEVWRSEIAAVIRATVEAERERCKSVVREECFHSEAAPCCKGNGADAIARILNPSLDWAGEPAPTWTTTSPIAPGWYWFRERPECAPAVYRVDYLGIGPTLFAWTHSGHEWELSELVKYSDRAEWCGPLEEPT